MTNPSNQRRILFLFSDTGGGHRSATEALIEALELEFGDRIRCKMVDIFKEYAPPPLDRMPNWYPYIVRMPSAWGLGYRLFDGHQRARLVTSSFWPYVRKAARQLVRQNPSDLIVSVHPFANATVLKALGKVRPPFVTVVTDLVTVHALWYHRLVDLCITPTEQARQRALVCGMGSEKLRVVGLPVAERFRHPPDDKKALRAELGWPLEKPLILLIAGGDGMGPLEEVADAIAGARLDACLVIIAGRNTALKAKLDAKQWPMPTFIYGFVRNMPEFMGAADILLTKAGPGTISEAFNAGLPLILYSRLPGQEDGNVTYVVSEKAGIWAPRTDLIINALRNWVNNPDQRIQASAACHRLARPNAARQIAQILAPWAGVNNSE